mmetsp:Transcript_12255/g.28392  ORF Transcript_12255/g.28392 Transcript_12255/m.28392 type:complete len:97 (+) Transcript_12255:279-569(+)
MAGEEENADTLTDFRIHSNGTTHHHRCGKQVHWLYQSDHAEPSVTCWSDSWWTAKTFAKLQHSTTVSTHEPMRRVSYSDNSLDRRKYLVEFQAPKM